MVNLVEGKEPEENRIGEKFTESSPLGLPLKHYPLNAEKENIRGDDFDSWNSYNRDNPDERLYKVDFS